MESAREAAARDLVREQIDLGYEYPTEGGFGQLDVFSSYVGSVDGVRSTGNIDKYPGTRNSYYHTPLVEGRVRADGGTISRTLLTSQFPKGCKRKAILPSPVSFALACENTSYGTRAEICRDFSEVLRADVKELSGLGYEYIQLTDAFLPSKRFAGRLFEGLERTLVESLATIFEGFRGRSAYYLHSDDASRMVPALLESGVTDVGFDFNTPLSALGGERVTKNLVLGIQNSTRKLPSDLLQEEPKILARRVLEAARSLKLAESALLTISPSQDYDGLQTYPQAVARMRNLAGAVGLAEGRA